GIEKVIRLKLKTLDHALQAHYQVSLGYAPEVLRYFLREVSARQIFSHTTTHPDKIFIPLYACVEQAIQDVDHQPSKKLFLQLHEAGHRLQCHWVAGATEKNEAATSSAPHFR